MNKQLMILMGCVMAVTFCASAETYLTDESTEYVGTGMVRYGSSNLRHVEGYDYVYNTDGLGSVTLTPGVTGSQYLQINWGQHALNSTAVDIVINHANGTDTVTVNQQQYATQGVSTNAPRNVPSGGSMGAGWYTLGKYELDQTSTVVVQDQAGTSGFNFDALRLSADTVILDINSAHFNFTAGWGGPYINNGIPNQSWDAYSCPKTSDPSFTVTPDTTGRHELFASWMVNSAHTGQVLYEVDLDGIAGSGDETIVGANQMYDANVQAVANGEWSGWKSLGEYDVTENTVIRTTYGVGGSYLSAANFMVQEIPEPATVTLLGIGGVLALRRRRR